MTITLTLDMQIPNSTGRWTLAEAVADLKRMRLARLLVNSDEELSEQYDGFRQALQDGTTPTIGQIWAAYYLAVIETLDEDYYGKDAITTRQYAARKAALTRLVFRATSGR